MLQRQGAAKTTASKSRTWESETRTSLVPLLAIVPPFRHAQVFYLILLCFGLAPCAKSVRDLAMSGRLMLCGLRVCRLGFGRV
jgi:hypothetical protein